MTLNGLIVPLALALLAASCTQGAETVTIGPGTSAGTLPPATPGTAPGVAAGLITVFDGDTLLASVDAAEEEVRLLGINAPEREECFGPESRRAAAGLLQAGPLTLEVMSERDQFGRLLAYAYAGGTLVNLALLEGGQALAIQSEHSRRAEFLAADEAAFAAGVGMWAADACGPPSAASVHLVDIEPNPPGPDEDDPNGEWVLLANTGAEAADLSGWVLRDESSEHRYHFPNGAVLPPGEEVALHSGCGADTPTDAYWCASGPVWTNGGDTALLLDPTGNVAARLRYTG